MTSPFTIVLMDSNENVIGASPITDVLTIEETQSLDRIGELTLTVPAGNAIASLVDEGSLLDVYDEKDGYLGRWYFFDDEISDTGNQAIQKIKCFSQIIELNRQTVAFRRNYQFNPIQQVIEELATVASWRAECESGIGNTTVSYEGDSVLAAIDEIRDRFKAHYRLQVGSRRVLEFGLFGQNRGYRATNLAGQMQTVYAAHANVAIAETLTRRRNGEAIANRIIALGAGDGIAQLTMEGATAGEYELLAGANKDSSLYYYIEDTDSIARHGLRTKVLTLPNIRPLSPVTAATKLNAANSLKKAAEAYLRTHVSGVREYDLQTRNLSYQVAVGDKLWVVYRAARENVVYLDVNEEFYVMDIRRSRSASGDRHEQVTLSSTGERRTTDQDVMAETIKTVEAGKKNVKVQTFTSREVQKDTTAAYGPNLSTNPDKPAKFSILITDKYIDLTSVYLVFRATPPATNNYVTGGKNIAWIFEGTEYPVSMTMTVNDVDVTDDYTSEGAFNAVGANVETTWEADITDLILNAEGGMYQRHTIEVQCGYRENANAALPGESAYSQLEYGHGLIECEITVQATTQASR